MGNGFVQRHRPARSYIEQSDRLFLAAVPDVGTASRIYELAGIFRRAHKFKGDLIKPEHLHISLFFLGSWDDGLPEMIITKVHRAADELKSLAFEVTLDRTMSFSGQPENSPFVLVGDSGVGQLKVFRKALGVAMTRNDLRRWVHTNFTPHVTLLYDERGVDEQPIEPISWRVGEFVLVRSLYGQTKHIHLARWHLPS
jgi:2'-5' RNA ligase